jgi:hypothetical protein
MRVKQVVEELHIELIVLHDQDSFGFGVHDFTPRPGHAVKFWDGTVPWMRSIKEKVLTLS